MKTYPVSDKSHKLFMKSQAMTWVAESCIEHRFYEDAGKYAEKAADAIAAAWGSFWKESNLELQKEPWVYDAARRIAFPNDEE